MPIFKRRRITSDFLRKHVPFLSSTSHTMWVLHNIQYDQNTVHCGTVCLFMDTRLIITPSLVLNLCYGAITKARDSNISASHTRFWVYSALYLYLLLILIYIFFLLISVGNSYLFKHCLSPLLPLLCNY